VVTKSTDRVSNEKKSDGNIPTYRITGDADYEDIIRGSLYHPIWMVSFNDNQIIL